MKHQIIIRGMALAFFANAYADQAEENDQALSGEIMDQLPGVIDPGARHAARTLAIQIASVNGVANVADLYDKAASYNRTGADRELTPELFGHYCAMQAMGTGVGLESFGYEVDRAITVPYVEFGSHSLEQDYFA